MEARQSSIHIEAVGDGSFLHNSRDVKVSYLVDSSDKNECSLSSQNSFILFHALKKEATENYTKRTGQKIQKSTNFLKEAIINLEEHHTLEDLEPIKKKLESYGFKVIQMSIHRDEGHEDEGGNLIKNYHAHVTFFNLKEDGTTVKFGKNYRTELSKLQTFVAENLNMERGGCSVKEHAEELGVEITKAKRRLNTYDYKRAMQLKEEDFKNIKIEVTKLQEKEQKYIYNYREMQQKITSLENLDAEQKKELHKLNSAAKKDSSRLWDLYQQIQELKNTPPSTIKVENPINLELQTKNEELSTQNLELQTKNEELKNTPPSTIKVENPINLELQTKNEELSIENEQLQIELETLKNTPPLTVENPVNKELEKERNKYKNLLIGINRNQKKMAEMVKDLEVKETDGFFEKVYELFLNKDKEIKKLKDRFEHIIKQEEIENKNKEELNEIKQKFIQEYVSHYSSDDTKAAIRILNEYDKKTFKQIISLETENDENKTLVLLAVKYKKLEQEQQVQQRQEQEQEQVQQKEQQVEQQSGYSPYSR